MGGAEEHVLEGMTGGQQQAHAAGVAHDGRADLEQLDADGVFERQPLLDLVQFIEVAEHALRQGRRLLGLQLLMHDA